MAVTRIPVCFLNSKLRSVFRPIRPNPLMAIVSILIGLLWLNHGQSYTFRSDRMKQNIGAMRYTNMSKNEKFEPKDSEQQRPKADQTVKHAKDRDYQEEEPTITA